MSLTLRDVCSQFLPQDRVYDFCKLKPEDILKETEKAAGDANMFAEHEELIKFGSEESVKAEVPLLTGTREERSNAN